MSDRKDIIMNFSAPPLIEDIEALASDILETLPDDLLEYMEDDSVDLVLEEFPDGVLEEEMELETPYELLALYRKGEEILPGAIKKNSNNGATLVLYRRSILDAWCDTNDDFRELIRYVIVTEIAQSYGFSGQDIDKMIKEHYQGLLF